MNKMSVKTKLGLGFGILLVVLAIMGIVGYTSTKELDALSDVVDANVQKKEFTVAMSVALEKQTSGVRGYLLSGDENLVNHYEQGKSEFAENANKLEPLLVVEAAKKLLTALRLDEESFMATQERAIKLGRAGKAKEASALIFGSQNNAVKADLQKNIADLVALESKLKKAAVDEQNATESRTAVLTLILSITGIVFGLIVAWLIARSVTGAISRMLALIQELAANNLTVEDMQVTSQDEIGKAGTALNRMKNNLREMIQSIAGTAEHVASASEEISSSATQQAQGAETQKDQTTQVATAMQEMPRSCAEAGVLQRVVGLQQIPEQIVLATRCSRRA